MGFSRALKQLAGLRRTHAVVDIADNSTTVFTGKCRLIGVVVNTGLSAHTVPIKDDTTAVITLPASASAGDFFDCYGVVFDTSLVVDPNDAGTGNITVVYEPVEDF